MEIKTKFAIGDKLWTVNGCKAVQFEVVCIFYNGEVRYGDSRYSVTPESMCFATKEELLKYVADNGNESL